MYPIYDMDSSSDYLYNPALVQELDFSDTAVFKKDKLSSSNAGENLVMRPLCLSDYYKDYLKLMAELTSTGDISHAMFKARFDQMKSCKGTYLIVVIENVAQTKIAASGSLIIEKHLNENVRVVTRGRIEDIVVLESHRGKQLGKLILETLVLLAKKVRCDELSLECKDHLIRFYTKFGLVHQPKEQYMTLRYDKH